MTYIIMGPQGSGKGTQAKLLAQQYGLKHISMGDVLRKEIALGSDIGKVIEGYMNKGELIPMHINNALAKKLLDENKNVLLDGYPRNVEQAEFLFSLTKIKCVVVINISQEESVRRLCKRVICSANNKIFIEDKITDEEKQECARLGGAIVKRDDDKPEAICKRLQIYRELTWPVVEFLKQKNVPIVEVDGEKPVEGLFEEIRTKSVYFFDSE